jgi:rubrerythrin
VVNALKGRKYAWAQYYNTISTTHDQDHQHYNTLTTTIQEDNIPSHIKNQLTDMAKELKKKWECPICMDFIPDGEVEITNCGHFFCKDCLKNLKQVSKNNHEDKWSCPVCRKKHNHNNDS